MHVIWKTAVLTLCGIYGWARCELIIRGAAILSSDVTDASLSISVWRWLRSSGSLLPLNNIPTISQLQCKPAYNIDMNTLASLLAALGYVLTIWDIRSNFILFCMHSFSTWCRFAWNYFQLDIFCMDLFQTDIINVCSLARNMMHCYPRKYFL